jgi:hypothetical protein
MGNKRRQGLGGEKESLIFVIIGSCVVFAMKIVTMGVEGLFDVICGRFQRCSLFILCSSAKTSPQLLLEEEERNNPEIKVFSMYNW